MEKYLIVVDMQNDFVTGTLGTPEAAGIVPNVTKKVKEFDGTVIFTRDTHYEDYLETQEGKKLPIKHCIFETYGWELIEDLKKLQLQNELSVYNKNTFGSVDLVQYLKERNKESNIKSIELIGLCTDICVVSNALLIKANIPEVPVIVDSSCCAGVNVESHEAALQTMRSCQVVVN